MFDEDLYSEEELGLFNPAFMGVNLYHSIREFYSVDVDGMHCALPFILIPMAMNAAIRRELPQTSRTPVASWVARNEGLLSVLVPQVGAYIPIVKAAVSFLLDHRLIKLSSAGHYLLGDGSLPANPKLFTEDSDMQNILRSAKFLGRWFAHSPSAETIYAQLGMMP